LSYVRRTKRMPETILYTFSEQPESESAFRLLESAGYLVRKVDVKVSGVEAFLKRDLGTDQTPIWVTPQGILSGLEAIKACLQR
jgi:hypothetical protein